MLAYNLLNSWAATYYRVWGALFQGSAKGF